MFSFNPSQWCSNSYIPLLKVVLSHDKTEGGRQKTFDYNIYIEQRENFFYWFCSGEKICHTSYPELAFTGNLKTLASLVEVCLLLL